MEGEVDRQDSGFGGETTLHSMDEKEDQLPDPENKEKYYDACDNIEGGLPEGDVPTQNEEGPNQLISLVLVGKTGNGKSATANTISGKKNLFPEARSLKSVTTVCQREVLKVAGYDLVLVDTPGNFDTENKHQALVEIGHAVHLEPSGYDAILVVLRIDVRLTKEERKAVDEFRKVFGSELFKRYAIVIFTRGDQFDSEDDEPFIKSVRREGGDFMNSFLDECQNRCIMFNNKLKEGSDGQVRQLLDMVQNLRQKNGHNRYTNHHFKDAKEQKEAFHQFQREKSLELQKQLHEFKDQKKKRDKELSETEKTLKDECERQRQFKIQEEKVRLRDKWNRQMENERQKYIRNLKVELNNREGNTTFHVYQVTFDGAFIENELKNTLEKYLLTKEEAWQKMVSSEVDQYKAELDIICSMSNVENISETVDSVKQLRKNVDDLKNEHYISCGEKLKCALDQRKHVMKFLKAKRREDCSTKLKEAISYIEREGICSINREFDEIKTTGYNRIETYTVSTETRLKGELDTMEKLIWNETENNVYAKMNPLFDQVRDQLQKMTKDIVSNWGDKTVRNLLQETTEQLLQSFDTISLEIDNHFGMEMRVAKVSAEKLFQDTMTQGRLTRELMEIERFLDNDIPRQCSMMTESLSQAVMLPDELVVPSDLHNQVENDCTNETESLKAVAAKHKQDQENEWAAHIDNTIIVSKRTFEKVRKEQLSESREKWYTSAENERKERKHAFERKVEYFISAAKQEIVSNVDRNVKASDKIKADIKKKIDSLEKTWKGEIMTLIEEKEREWKEKHNQCLPENLFDTCFGHIQSSVDSKLQEQLFSLQKEQEKEWDKNYTEKLAKYVIQFESEHKNILLFSRTTLDEKAERVLKEERERYQEISQMMFESKVNYWAEVVKEQKLLFLQRATDTMRTKRADFSDYKEEWKETITRKRKDFERQSKKAINGLKSEAEEQWQIKFDTLKREYKAVVASKMTIYAKQLNEKTKLKRKRGKLEEKWKPVIKEQTEKAKQDLYDELTKSASVCMEPYQKILEDRRVNFEGELLLTIRKSRESKDTKDYDEICKMACGKTMAERFKLCFCPESYVIDASFRKRKLKHVELDTSVLCYRPEGGFCFSKIYRFGRKESMGDNVFVEIQTKSKTFMASPNHHIHVGATVDYKHTKSAIEIQPGETVFVCHDKELVRETVLSVSMTRNRGLCTPYTNVGTIIVDGVLASCYVDRVKPFLAHRLLAPVRLFYKLLPNF